MISNILIIILVSSISKAISRESVQCPVNCFFTDNNKEFIECNVKSFNKSYISVNVECPNNDEIIIGSMESLRSLTKNFLSNLKFIKYLSINLNLMTLDPDILISDSLLELKLTYIKQIDRYSFYNLENIENIDFGKITSEQMPEFFILKHRQNRRTTQVNIAMECYKCKEDSDELLVFPTVTKASQFNLYIIQSINSDNCPIKPEIIYCNNSDSIISNEKETNTHRFLRLDQKPVSKDSDIKIQTKIPINIFYIGLILCLSLVVLIIISLLLQLYTIRQLRKATVLIKGFSIYPGMLDSELSDNNETNSCLGNNSLLYHHNFTIPK